MMMRRGVGAFITRVTAGTFARVTAGTFARVTAGTFAGVAAGTFAGVAAGEVAGVITGVRRVGLLVAFEMRCTLTNLRAVVGAERALDACNSSSKEKPRELPAST